MKVLFMVDWQEDSEWLWDYVPSHGDEVDFFVTEGVTDRFSGYGKFLSRYPRYVAYATRALPTLRQYDAVVAWTGKNGIPIALLQTLRGRRGPKLIILNMSVRGPITAITPVIRLTMSSVDVVTYVSEGEMRHSNRALRMPDSKIRIVKPGWISETWIDRYFSRGDTVHSSEPYIFSSGRSFRDYATLFSAMQDIDRKLVVNARPYDVKGLSVPDNVQINDILPPEEFYALLAGAEFVVIPLRDVPHGAGESHLIHVMAAGKPVIITQNPSVTSFVDVEEIGLLVEPGDVGGMRDAIQYLLNHPQEAHRMGQRGRELFRERHSMEIFAKKVHELVHEIV
jgi:glycosyltransferase involved in cell wall biosynthesis